MERRKVGILGSTGMVGQRFIQLLSNHPWFEIAWLAASDRSAGKTYGEACRWKLDTPLPKKIAAMTVQPNVPLVVPEVNADHLELLEAQSWRKENGGKGGYIVTHPNCSAIGLVLALKPLEERFGIESMFVSTMQAVSGAGYPGVASLDILGNVVPYIKNEEEKMQEEVGKLLGRLNGNRIEILDAKVSAHCNRVAVEDGHTECVSIKFKKKAVREEILEAWNEFLPLQGLHLPTAPDQPVEYDAAVDRPQPRLDRMRGSGMAATVG